jgi:hypothetical protein
MNEKFQDDLLLVLLTLIIQKDLLLLHDFEQNDYINIGKIIKRIILLPLND